MPCNNGVGIIKSQKITANTQILREKSEWKNHEEGGEGESDSTISMAITVQDSLVY